MRQNADDWIANRIALEVNKTLQNLGINEFGDEGKIKRRMYHYPDCQDAYINLFCFMNFPRCDPETNETLPLCRSLCENFFVNCGYEQNLWRCGKTKWFNGYFPEPPSAFPGLPENTSYLRDYFPGQPWRKNKFTRKGFLTVELPICTPGIYGAAPRRLDLGLGLGPGVIRWSEDGFGWGLGWWVHVLWSVGVAAVMAVVGGP